MISNLFHDDTVSGSDNIGVEYNLDFILDWNCTKSDSNDYSFSINQEFPSILRSILDKPLKRDLGVSIVQDGDYWFINCDDLNIYESGDNYFDALMSFSSFFLSDMEYYKNADDQELTEDAKDLKNKYLSYL